MRQILCYAAMLSLIGLFAGGCTTSPRTETGKEALVDDARAALKHMQDKDPGLRDFLDHAYAYAIFPSVGKGGIGVGGAYGKGVVFQNGQVIGYSDLTQATVGLQLGGQTYSELIVFENEQALNDFKSNNFAFAAQASAVAVKAGASTAARYEHGVAVFTMPQGGLMFEASVGGQRFTFQPVS